MTSEPFHFQNRNSPNLPKCLSRAVLNRERKKSISGAPTALSALSLSLLELTTRAPTGPLPRSRFTLYYSARGKGLLSFPSQLLLQRGTSLSQPQAVHSEAMLASPLTAEGGLPQTSDPKGQAQPSGREMEKVGIQKGCKRQVRILALSLTSSATWTRCFAFLSLEGTVVHMSQGEQGD